MLDENDQKFLEDSFQDVRRILVASSGSVQKADECLSYLTDVYLEYDHEKSTNFPRWAAKRCILRKKDEDRRSIGATRYNNHFKVKKLKDFIEKESYKNPDSEEIKKAERELMEMNSLDSYYCNRSFEDLKVPDFAGKNSTFAEVEWNDLKRKIVEKSEQEFPDIANNPRRNRRNLIFRTLIKDYFLEKAENDSRVTVESIAQRMEISPTTLITIKKSDRLKNFFERVLEIE